MLKQKDRLTDSVAAGFNIGKIKNKNHDELRHYRGVIRELEKEVRKLKKELAYYKKHEHTFEQTEDSPEEIEESKADAKLKTCESCGKGKMKEFEIVGRIYATCDICEERVRIK